jgi:DNA-binding CsgD family transcriptional regulator
MKLDQTDKEILNFLSQGKTAREIGKLVFLSYWAVVKRKGKLKESFGAKNDKELITLALKSAQV